MIDSESNSGEVRSEKQPQHSSACKDDSTQSLVKQKMNALPTTTTTTTTTNNVPWRWKQEWSGTALSNNGLTSKDIGSGKAWTTSVAHTPVPAGGGYYYYEIKIDVCNVSNSIKIVFGILTSHYLKKILSKEIGKMGSLKGGCPFGYFPSFGKGTLCYFANGQIYKDGIEACKTEPFTKDDLVGMCVDTFNNTISFYKNHSLVGRPFHNVILELFDTDGEDDNSTHQELYPATSLIKENVVSIVPSPEISPTLLAAANNIKGISPSVQSTPNPTAVPNIQITTPLAATTALVTPVRSGGSTSTTSTTSTTTTRQHHMTSPTTMRPPPTPPLTSDPGNSCPICGISLKLIGGGDWHSVNKHIDECLTISLLDKEHGTEPYQIKCPYPECKTPTQLSKDFVHHCNDSHFLENNHSLECPLCKTTVPNLISHLSKKHIVLPSVKTESFVGVGYSTNILDHNLGSEQECAICLEEFFKGDKVARLECWCLFHEHCIAAFLVKSKKCPVHY
ncbi:hypothetical protein SAMD00019534_050720 [Acytostelium subglobosum LB1]|uniref:hypothetical protein n=1 Tax=Acytostelium subglobosum LB1 TaxID=1410327 RepID=UPI000644C5C9|nr:hypothetical protein SAMD00019534_050720 [Acytostelium subglobosum LB1]GAM21897.1 hypothetical protein SAMD00019534_050720 [Acytostelium subglobosum LB1]|eukprot:XP_012754997.1 hypothetical protein SAMD00019534_050720 [Acytostelium subglobosum LB1]